MSHGMLIIGSHGIEKTSLKICAKDYQQKFLLVSRYIHSSFVERLFLQQLVLSQVPMGK